MSGIWPSSSGWHGTSGFRGRTPAARPETAHCSWQGCTAGRNCARHLPGRRRWPEWWGAAEGGRASHSMGLALGIWPAMEGKFVVSFSASSQERGGRDAGQELGHMDLPVAGCANRDQYVMAACRRQHHGPPGQGLTHHVRSPGRCSALSRVKGTDSGAGGQGRLCAAALTTSRALRAGETFMASPQASAASAALFRRGHTGLSRRWQRPPDAMGGFAKPGAGGCRSSAQLAEERRRPRAALRSARRGSAACIIQN